MTRHAPRSSALRVALVAALVVSASAQSADAPCAAERLERLPRLCEPREAAPGRDASCCAELAALNDARCFCGESIARLSGEAQRALVPPLAAAQRLARSAARYAWPLSLSPGSRPLLMYGRRSSVGAGGHRSKHTSRARRHGGTGCMMVPWQGSADLKSCRVGRSKLGIAHPC